LGNISGRNKKEAQSTGNTLGKILKTRSANGTGGSNASLSLHCCGTKILIL